MILTRSVQIAQNAAALYDPVRVEFIGGRFVRLLQPIDWRGAYPATLPQDFVSDGGSIPAICWPLVGHPFSTSAIVAYLLHDFDLQNGLSWKEATARLDARLRALQIAPARRRSIVFGVRAYGWATGQ